MYRPFTTIGMNKKTEKLFYPLGILALGAGKLWYYALAGPGVVDSHGYYGEAVIRLQQEGTIYFSGLACVYTETLSDIFPFVGNRIEAAGICQLLFQVAWLEALFVGMGMIFGKAAGAVTAGSLALSPWIGETLFEICPENFYMLHWSVVAVVFGSLALRMKFAGWCADKWEALYLLLAGLYMGLVCYWNWLGFFLCLPAGYLLAKAYFAYGRKGLATAALAAGLFLGVTLGFFTVLSVDAGLTGTTGAKQFIRWFREIRQPGGGSQDMDICLALWLAGGLLAGVFSQWAFWCLGRKEVTGGMEKVADAKNTAEEEGQGNYIVTQDGRRIRLLDNPLPGPKKHVKRKMSFDIEEVGDLEELADVAGKEQWQGIGREEAEEKPDLLEERPLQDGFREELSGEEDDFDFQISQGDDFDL
ncbi:hypothetical protein IMSAGC019_01882 [Lachnospiraceae bacterium]|nr:hypothetical protein IMSAGC019_01882 [Lachnospiraceae bacterium]